MGVFKRGEAPLLKITSPSPRVERGIQGVRLIINNFRLPLLFGWRLPYNEVPEA
jgi:hypothetical protein